jgi:hypothetical protein
VALFPWTVTGYQNLSVVVEQRSDGPVPTRILKVANDADELYTYETADTFLGAMPLSEADGDLLSIWMGGSSYHLVVLGYHDGAIRKLLGTGSKMPPEVVFPSSNREQRPLILTVDGTMNEPRESWSSRAFSWDGMAYQAGSRVPYLTRMNHLP